MTGRDGAARTIATPPNTSADATRIRSENGSDRISVPSSTAITGFTYA